ncbi:MAG TPA: zinc-binding alcohol dehydrogenase family protein [Acidobacteriota bacterium]|nr:zinc-binding alcohol dehydrogenase family protein [Acidobacteriota bacterium]
MIKTEAWVLHQSAESNGCKPGPGRLRREEWELPDIGPQEVLAEPIYGCWEGNMAHALSRRPVDICRQRGEDKVVIGNAGVVRVLETGRQVSTVKSGDTCIVFCNGIWDDQGFPKKIYAYDAPGTVGLLARRTRLHERQLIPVPAGSRYSLRQWAAFSLRYITAWSNWKMAYGCWRLATASKNGPSMNGHRPTVWGWGGGVSFAEATLARLNGCPSGMISSCPRRLEQIAESGLQHLDRRQFAKLNFSMSRYQSDEGFRQDYQQAESTFLKLMAEAAGPQGVSIFIDFIGLPVYRATLKALARPGVVTTAGWKEGMNLRTLRALECMNWHMHVHTHYARYHEGLEAVEFAEGNGWLPPLDETTYTWNEIPQLADDYQSNRLSTYFPIFQVNTP